MRDRLEKQLETGLAKLDLSLSPKQIGDLVSFVLLLEKWNRSFNLTSVQNPEEMISRHVLDSLAIAPHLQGNTFADVGSGPGIPGIPLAEVFPERHFTLIDSRGKRSAFQRQAVITLGLKNVSILNIRAEDYQGEPFQGIISRAFASLADFDRLCCAMGSDDTLFYAMKGKVSEEEKAVLQERIVSVSALNVPGTDAARSLVVFRNNPKT